MMSERLSVTYLWVASKLLPIIGSCSGLVMLQLPHVSISQNDPPGIRRQPVHARIAGSTIRHCLHPIRRVSLTRDNRRQPILCQIGSLGSDVPATWCVISQHL